MGFVNVTYGLRAVGYVGAAPALSRAGRADHASGLGVLRAAAHLLRRRFTVPAVSSGQELVTTAAQYAEYALELVEIIQVLALVLEAIRQPGLALRGALWPPPARRRIPVVMLTAGAAGGLRPAPCVGPHRRAGHRHGGWEASLTAYGVHRAADLAETADTSWTPLPSPAGRISLRPAPLPAASPPRPPPPAAPRPAGPTPCGRRPATQFTPTPTNPNHTIQTTDPASPALRSASRPCTTPAGAGLRGRRGRRARRPVRGDQPGDHGPAGRPARPGPGAATRSTCGAPVPVPGNSYPVRWPRWPATRRCVPRRSPSTWSPADGDQSYPLAVTETARRTSKPSWCSATCPRPSTPAPPPPCVPAESRCWRPPGPACWR